MMIAKMTSSFGRVSSEAQAADDERERAGDDEPDRRIVRPKATMPSATNTGPRKVHFSRPSPSRTRPITRSSAPQRPTPIASQRGSIAGPIARSVPCGRSLTR